MKNDFLLVCNLKNNVVDKNQFYKKFSQDMQKNVIICPNFCDFCEFLPLKEKNSVKIGAQNFCVFDGSNTGEITVDILKNYEIDFCIVGHSEQRKNFFETDELINKKLAKLIENGITPILCVGENLCQNESQIEYAKKIVFEQLERDFEKIDLSKVVVAYEPIWAIGIGKTADKTHIESICKFIKSNFAAKACLYGGSVNLENFAEISKIENIDGVLIGKASLNPDNILKMQHILNE